MSAKERRRSMAQLTQIRKDRAAAKKLAQALEVVKAAGYVITRSAGEAG